jgi:integrase
MLPMGRRRTRDHGLPPHMAKKGRSYYYVTNTPRRWLPLGNDWPAALAQWAKYEGKPIPEEARNFSQVAKWYRTEIIEKIRSPATRRDATRELASLESVFGPSPIETIEPADVRTYLDNRVSRKKLKDGEKAPLATTRANREISRLSHVINCAREAGFTTMANPCTGVHRHSEPGRGRYAEDVEYQAIYEKADAELQDAMDLMLYTSQRPGDVILMRRSHRIQGDLHVRQGKTKTPLRIRLEGSSAPRSSACARASARPWASTWCRMRTASRSPTGSSRIDSPRRVPRPRWSSRAWPISRCATSAGRQRPTSKTSRTPRRSSGTRPGP